MLNRANGKFLGTKIEFWDLSYIIIVSKNQVNTNDIIKQLVCYMLLQNLELVIRK